MEEVHFRSPDSSNNCSNNCNNSNSSGSGRVCMEVPLPGLAPLVWDICPPLPRLPVCMVWGSVQPRPPMVVTALPDRRRVVREEEEWVEEEAVAVGHRSEARRRPAARCPLRCPIDPFCLLPG